MRSPNRRTPGSSRAGAAAERSRARISSRLPTPPPKGAEAVARHLGQLAPAAPGVEPGIAEPARQPGDDAAREPARQTVQPGGAQHQRAERGRGALPPRRKTLASQLGAPGEELVMQIDLHRAHV